MHLLTEMIIKNKCLYSLSIKKENEKKERKNSKHKCVQKHGILEKKVQIK